MPFRLRLRNTQNTQIWNVPETAEEQKRAGRKKMKILSIAVPCYNSEAYMEKCIDSLLVGGEEVEILIVDDGSKDGTTEIADRYQEKYPTIVKAIHQENRARAASPTEERRIRRISWATGRRRINRAVQTSSPASPQAANPGNPVMKPPPAA